LPIKATTINADGTINDVTAFTIENLRGYRWGDSKQEKRPCNGTNAPGGRVVQIVNNVVDWQEGYKKVLTSGYYSSRVRGGDDEYRMRYRFDYEECMGWEWDVVATAITPEGTKTATCKFKTIVSNHNDSPYWTEAIEHGDKYVIYGEVILVLLLAMCFLVNPPSPPLPPLPGTPTQYHSTTVIPLLTASSALVPHWFSP
jgi:hypothetical protein